MPIVWPRTRPVLPVPTAPRRTPFDESQHPSTVASARSSSDPAPIRSVQLAKTRGFPTSLPPATRNSPLAVDALEIADHQQAKVHARHHAGPPQSFGVERLTDPF